MDNLKILLVDDDKDFAELIEDVVMRYQPNSKIVHKENGHEGLEALKTDIYDILITDFNMPLMNGLELVRALKSLPKSHLPGDVLMLSSYIEPGEPDSDVSFVTYLNKLDFQEDFKNYVKNKFAKKKTAQDEVPFVDFSSVRSDERFEILEIMKVDIITENFVEIARMVNLSKAGMYISASKFLSQCNLGMEIDCMLTFSERNMIKVKGKIRHVESRNHYYIGIEFVDVDTDARNKLNEFIEKISSSKA